MKTNILFITSATRIGGAERTLLFILKDLNKNLFSLIVIIPGKGMLYDELEKLNIKVIKSGLIKKLNLLKMSFRLGKFRLYNLINIIANAILISFYFLSSAIVISILIKRTKTKIIYSGSLDIAARIFLIAALMRKNVIFNYQDILKPSIDNLLLRWLIDTPSRSICCSNSVRRSILRWSNNIDRIEALFNSIDLAIFDGNLDIYEAQRLKKGLNLSKFVVGIVGRFDLCKGHETFLEAASIVVKSIPDVSFLIVGSWVLDFEKGREEILKRYVKELGLEDKVVFTGFVADVKKYYHLMDIVAVPSWQEPMGLVVLEAMAEGRPVIGTNSGGIPEIIDNGITGILVPVQDAKALAQAIIRLWEDERLRNELAMQGRNTARKFFDGTQFMKNIEAVFMEALEIREGC
ncbi:MAG: glycosyltransferase family 4 protein [Candidatus Omnitrophota bacterium]